MTVPSGSVMSSTLLSPETTLAEGLTALTVLIALQYAITTIAVRWPQVWHLIKSDEVLLYYHALVLENEGRRSILSISKPGPTTLLEPVKGPASAHREQPDRPEHRGDQSQRHAHA